MRRSTSSSRWSIRWHLRHKESAWRRSPSRCACRGHRRERCGRWCSTSPTRRAPASPPGSPTRRRCRSSRSTSTPKKCSSRVGAATCIRTSSCHCSCGRRSTRRQWAPARSPSTTSRTDGSRPSRERRGGTRPRSSSGSSALRRSAIPREWSGSRCWGIRQRHWDPSRKRSAAGSLPRSTWPRRWVFPSNGSRSRRARPSRWTRARKTSTGSHACCAASSSSPKPAVRSTSSSPGSTWVASPTGTRKRPCSCTPAAFSS